MKESADIGLIGLAVMGQNLVLNMADHGYRVAVFNRTKSKCDSFLAGPAAGRDEIVGTASIGELVASLRSPKRVVVMVKAGSGVDAIVEQLIPHLGRGDIVIDGGNSFYQDTVNRVKELGERGIHYVGAGISGGEEGARLGPSIMPGGAPAAWEHIGKLLRDIAAKSDDGEPCCDWVGGGGAGHFVKMVHNGIEYGDMQLIAEGYHLMRVGFGMDPDQISSTLSRWAEGNLSSYLIEITRDIVAYRDEDGAPLVDKILDTAGQKGTGKWTVASSLELGVPVTLIGESVFARYLSSLKEERIDASRLISRQGEGIPQPEGEQIDDLAAALFASKIVSYAQGFMLMREASESNGWELNYGGVAQMWRGGCIIRSSFLDNIKEAYDRNPALRNLMLDEYFLKRLNSAQEGWRRTVVRAVKLGIPLPGISSALAFFDGYRSDRLPANMIQAQRDYFGAHTYERVDRPRGEFFHTNWTGRGGDMPSTTYTA